MCVCEVWYHVKECMRKMCGIMHSTRRDCVEKPYRGRNACVHLLLLEKRERDSRSLLSVAFLALALLCVGAGAA